jgi:hypothetical protein
MTNANYCNANDFIALTFQQLSLNTFKMDGRFLNKFNDLLFLLSKEKAKHFFFSFYLDVKTKMHYITIMYNVILSF